MALHMNLMVNGQQIGYLVARRLSPPGQPSGNDVCQYEWKLNVHGETRSSLPGKPVEHRYGDGAWALAFRVIDAAGRGPTVTVTDWTEVDG